MPATFRPDLLSIATLGLHAAGLGMRTLKLRRRRTKVGNGAAKSYWPEASRRWRVATASLAAPWHGHSGMGSAG
jgi:hypothetical protein